MEIEREKENTGEKTKTEKSKKKNENEIENKLLRICTKCLVEKPTSEFYVMGNRLDSWCKPCKKQKRTSTYVSQKKNEAFDSILNCFQLILKFEGDQLDAINDQLEGMIRVCQHREPQ